MDEVKITFGMIVINGEPFTRYNLRSIYPFAHQIIVVEGACRAAAGIATPDGHSLDDTLEILRRFKGEEDPDNKLVIVTARDDGYFDGFWPEKDEMSRAYASRATGNYLWQVDSDEFYLKKDMEQVCRLLSGGVDAISFPALHFFGRPSYKVEGFHLISDRYSDCHRVFKWGSGYQYKTHRPPTVLDEHGIDVRKKNWIDADRAKKLGLTMFHYSYLFPHQVLKKAAYYSTNNKDKGSQRGYIPGADRWAREVYLDLARPFRMFITEHSLCWLERYQGPHPQEIDNMMKAISRSELPVQVRQTEDIECLLNRPAYAASGFILNRLAHLFRTRIGYFLRRYSLAFLRYWREGTLWDHILRRNRPKTLS